MGTSQKGHCGRALARTARVHALQQMAWPHGTNLVGKRVLRHTQHSIRSAGAAAGAAAAGAASAGAAGAGPGPICADLPAAAPSVETAAACGWSTFRSVAACSTRGIPEPTAASPGGRLAAAMFAHARRMGWEGGRADRWGGRAGVNPPGQSGCQSAGVNPQSHRLPWPPQRHVQQQQPPAQPFSSPPGAPSCVPAVRLLLPLP